jgi:AraC family transcriptional regulator
MEARFVKRPAVTLAGYILNTTSKDGENFRAIPKFWAAYVTDGRMKDLHGEPFLKSHDEYGACLREDPVTGTFEYLIGAEVQDGAAIPDSYQVREIPPAEYAVFSSPPADGTGFSDAIQNTWRRLFAEWLPNSGYDIDPKGIQYELYDERSMSETAKVCDICVPVVKR